MSANKREHIDPEEMAICMKVLQQVASTSGTIPRDIRFNSLISKIYREGKRHDLNSKKAEARKEDLETLSNTSMVKIQRDAVSAAKALTGAAPPTKKLNSPESCYVCKQPYTDVHFFYHYLCPTCAEYNYQMRDIHSDLTGRTALVTGGRVKIGFQTVLRLLRDGANVIMTTRFPASAALRFDEEPDADRWRNQLRLYGLDLRNIPVVEEFSQMLLKDEPAIDIIIHNAAQTIKRPTGFYQQLVEQELDPSRFLPDSAMKMIVGEAPSTIAVSDSSALIPGVISGVGDVLPADRLHDNEELADSRNINSWLLRLDEVGPQEMLEVQLVNSVAPFLLNSRLKPLLMKSPFERRFIVNVSAMEGQFYRHKSPYHPHTNMAKAALNMMTRTSADDYAKDKIYMNSVDTGWVTEENPGDRRIHKQENLGFFPPLDIIDGMARIYHPIAEGVNKPDIPIFGKFLKDYAECRW